MMVRRARWLAAFPVSLALACAIWAPRASAETAIRSAAGVQIIVFKRDAPARKERRARPAQPKPARLPKSIEPARTAMRDAALRGATSLIAGALSYLGTPYAWGGTSPSGFDCSGFTYYAYARLGIRIPRTADAQYAAGRPISGDPLPGDLVFFQTYDYGASHVGIYLGNGRFVNSIGDNVHVASFASNYFRSRYIGARRFLE